MRVLFFFRHVVRIKRKQQQQQKKQQQRKNQIDNELLEQNDLKTGMKFNQ